MEKKAIFIDWFQCTFICELFNVTERRKSFVPKLRDQGTATWHNILDIYYNNKIIFVVCYGPRAAFLNSNLILVKVINEALYTENWQQLLMDFEKVYDLKFNNITRLDVCVDFINFNNELKPHLLIEGFLKGDYIKSGKGKFSVIGNYNKALDLNYLRFGEPSGDISAYLYNKSKELREVKTKPYITDLWKQLFDHKEEEVWRLEFSLKLPKIILKDLTNKTTTIVDHYLHINTLTLNHIFAHFLHTNFRFFINEGYDRKDRNTELVLFSKEKLESRRLRLYHKSDGTRSDRILINKVLRSDRELREYDEQAADDMISSLFPMAESKNLTPYLNKRINAYVEIRKKDPFILTKPINEINCPRLF